MTFSFEVLCFLGTLPFPRALCTRWGSWVTRLEISISPQNKKPERDIIIFARRCGFPLHQKRSCWFYGKLHERLKRMKRRDFSSEFQFHNGEWRSGICIRVRLHLVCSWTLRRSSGRVPNWPHDTAVCMLGLRELLMKNTRGCLTGALE